MSNKIFDVVELIKMVRDGNIPENNRFIFKSTITRHYNSILIL